MSSQYQSSAVATSNSPHTDVTSNNMKILAPTVDLLCVGFGLSSIAIATALADRNPDGRVSFLEQDKTFSWGTGKTLSDNKLRTPFLRDLITTQNPRSRFTFINYLHSTNQIVAFTNASALCPSKLVMDQYLEWVAKQIENLGWVSYESKVIRIQPVKECGASQVNNFRVHYENVATGERSVITSKRVIVATGFTPFVPAPLSTPTLAPYVMHASSVGDVLTHDPSRIPDVAVIGASQEGAEIFEELQAHYGGHRATFFIEDSALRPSDATGLYAPSTRSQPLIKPADIIHSAQSLLDVPSAETAAFPPELRKKLQQAKHNNSKPDLPISLKLIEHLYDMDYAQKIGERDSSKYRFSIEPLAQVTGAEIVDASSGSAKPRVRLQLTNPRNGAVRMSDRTFDVVVAATGYRKAADSLVAGLASLLAMGEVSVGRDYRVNFREGVLSGGCGIYSMGSLADHSVSLLYLVCIP